MKLKTKNKLKFTSSILSVILLITSIHISVSAASPLIPSGTGAADDPYQIGTAAQLKWFASKANSAEKKTALNAILIDDIILNEGEITGETVGANEWTPILDYASTFDGQGHTISGIFVKDNASNYVGLFGSVYKGTVKNVGISNSYFEGYQYIGAIAGYSYNAVINACSNNATVKARSNTSTTSYAGGIVGYGYYQIHISNCYNTGAISSASHKGGIIGYAATNGNSHPNYVNNCYNYSNIITSIGEGLGSSDSVTSKNYVQVSEVKYDNQKTAEEFASGKIAYILNNNITGGSTWYQNIDMGMPDPYPVLDDSHYRVYYNSATDTYTNKCNSVDGFTPDDIYYKIDTNNNLLELAGDTTMTPYTAESRSPWYSSRNYIHEIKISGDLISDISAFEGMKNLTTIYVDKGSAADNSSLYPENVTIKYNDGSSREDSSSSTESSTETSTEASTESSTEASTESSTEASTESSTETYIHGDVDGDGKVTLLDVSHVFKKAMDSTYLFPIEKKK